MRFLIPTLLSIAALASPLAAQAQPAAAEKKKATDISETPKETKFNGEAVPQMKQLGANAEEDIKKGYWLVEMFSPSCPHCIAFAPTWQTIYEWYYTSKTIGDQKAAEGLNSFTRYYDFRFARLNCQAFMDQCAELGGDRFPTVALFKDGKQVKKTEGTSTMEEMNEMIEGVLDSIRPGSRPKAGRKLPEVGADHSPDYDPSAPKPSVAPVKPKKPKKPVNLEGTSVALTTETFQQLVSATKDPWFVKFYAPWCHHCQAMQPNWLQMARDMQGKLSIGEVNCEAERKLCKDLHVQGYPTMMLFKGGERIEYDGMRATGDLISYAKSAVEISDGVPEVDLASFKKMADEEEVVFIYFYDHATTSEDLMALERLTLSLIGHAKLVKSNDPKLAAKYKISTWPRFMVSRSGKPTFYGVLSPKEMRDPRLVLPWMRKVWLPMVPELTSANAREIMDGKIVVLGILNRERGEDLLAAKREIKNAALEWIEKQEQMMKLERQELRDAKQLRIEEAEDRDDQRALRAAKSIRIDMNEIERKEVRFAWVDGVFWERWLRTTYGVNPKEGDKVIINDESNHRYWDHTINGEPIRCSRTSILETIAKVVHNPPKIPSKSTTSWFGDIYFKIRRGWGSHPWLLLGVIVALLFSALWGKGRIRRGRSFAGSNGGGFFQLDGKEGLLGNSNSNGKVD